jgi:hypothetical protein
MNPEEFAGVASFAIGVVRGARSFRVDDDGMLTGIAYKQIWTPGENLAGCRKWETYIPITAAVIDGTFTVFIAPVPDTRYQTAPDTMLSCRHGFYGY